MPLTKKEKESLRSRKAEVAPCENLFMVSMMLTKGEVMALQRATYLYGSPVGQDVAAYLKSAVERSFPGDEDLESPYKEI